ncbi:MAG: LysM peptidoglycan-binding domain-containing protein [Phycisphaerales bacterium]|nr:LysM peptidoglycan-binding domain-containing protein [Phycisphaerales bacterium]
MLRWGVASVVALGLMLGAGCNKPKPASTDTQSPDMYSGGYDTGYQNPSTLSGTNAGAADPYASGATGGGRTHVVAKGDTLYSLARQYYGNQSKWRDILEANRAQISNPDQIKVGQKLVIP